MDSSDSDFSDCDCEELQDHTKLPRPPDGDIKEGKLLLKKGPVLAPNHEDLIRAGSSLGSISLPPKHLQLSPNHQELVWMGSSLGTMHKFLPKPKKKDSIDSFKGSQISGIQRIPSNLSRSKLSSCRFGSQTVSESGTDNYSFCRICQMQGDDRDPLFSPCRCSGSLRYVHGSCLKKWIRISQRRGRRKKPPRCEICHFPFNRHKRFKFSQWRWPRVNARDKCLHIIFLLNLVIMIGCAIATIMCFLSDRDQVNKFPKNKTKLTTEEIITLTCGVMFFVAFFIAMTVEIKARHTLYKLFMRFLMHNTEWTVEQYDKKRDPMYIVSPASRV